MRMRTIGACAALLAGAVWVDQARAIGDDIDPGDMAARVTQLKATQTTCEEFLVLGVERQTKLVWFMEGFSRNGKLEDEAVGTEELDRPVAAVVEACKKTPKESVFSVLKRDWKKAEKKM